jgi:hypothetical protein
MVRMFNNVAFNSTNFKTSITIMNPNVEYYGNMFSGVATKGDSKVTVNYIGKTSELVDKMIATKFNNSNVVKGSKLDTISFTIDGTTYYADEGMTWKEWVDSEYNNAGIFYHDFNEEVCWTDMTISNVEYSDLIISNGNYFASGSVPCFV